MSPEVEAVLAHMPHHKNNCWIIYSNSFMMGALVDKRIR